jgi:hypothetical protein
MKRTMAVLLLVFASVCSHAQAQDISKAAGNVPKEKQTSLGLYLTAREAYEKWKADPKQVKILDVRTPEEFLPTTPPGFTVENWQTKQQEGDSTAP